MEYPNYEEEDFGLEGSFLDEEGNEDNILSAKQEHDYSARRMLFLISNEAVAPPMEEVFRLILPHGNLDFVKTVEEGEAAILEAEESGAPYDTFVVDFKEAGVAESAFTKKILGRPGALLLAIDYAATAFDEDKNRYKLEPLRRLFDIEVRKTAEESAEPADPAEPTEPQAL
jgi:hypothetical protein